MTLPVNVDSTYADRSPGDKAHQQHHDEIHAAVNGLPGTYLTQAAASAAFVAKAEQVKATVVRTTAASIPHATRTALGFESELVDTDNMYDFAAAAGRVTFQRSGTFLLTASGVYANNSVGIRHAVLTINAVDVAQHRQAAAELSEFTVTAVVHVVAGDYARLELTQTSGGELNVTSARISAVRIAP